MKLTGKCKEDFEKWYFKNHCQSSIKYEELMPHQYHDVFGWFYRINLSFQYGVYVDFFDEKGIEIDIDIDSKFRYEEPEVGFYIYTEHQTFDSYDFTYKTRQEVREQAILKANEIYNSKQ